jgi:cytochrome P450
MSATKTPPGPPGHWLLGHTFAYERDPLGFMTRCAREYGDVVSLRFPGMPTVMFNHPDQIEYVLRTAHQNFIKDKFTRRMKPLLGEGLLTSEGAQWRRQRRLVQPSFHHAQIQQYGAVMVADADRMLRDWKPGETRNIHHEMMRLTLQIVARTLFDVDVAGEAKEVGELLEIVMDFFVNPLNLLPGRLWIPTPLVLRFRRAAKRLDAIIRRMIEDRRPAAARSTDLISRLLTARDEAGAAMSDQQIRDELITLFLAGHETTALTLTYCFWLLGQNPHAEGKLVEELQTVLGGRPPTAADAPRLTYTEWVVKESMRLYPPAWGVARQAIDDCEVGGWFIPKGTQLALTQWIVHRDARWFDEPEEFKPERWADDLQRRLPRGAYFPFGDGPRICIGQGFAMLEAVLLLATIAQRFRLRLVPDQRFELVPSITVRPRYGVQVVVEPRSEPVHRLAESLPVEPARN